mmetsp:Transcript_23272/g.64615  ORF Transcript_23272/g.64615 Transcript_23272/m.64615 type:complete len:298 (+) Transcript_23272:181-1074(+)
MAKGKKAKRESSAEEIPAAKAAKVSDNDTPASAAKAVFRNKEKVLVLSTRGITHRHRHLMLDLCQLIPHGKKDSKLDTKTDRQVINEVADLSGCSSCLFFEARKRKDLYLWMAKTGSGPSVKFHVKNIHTMDELKLSGNHLKGSRPVLSFHAAFDQEPHLQLLKEMLTQAFATPKGHNRSKPFFDHVISFAVGDNHIWVRNYQTVLPDNKPKNAKDMTLVEVGPRFCLNPVKIFAGSFRGVTLYENPAYVSPNTIRAMEKKQSLNKYSNKVKNISKRKQHKAANKAPVDLLSSVFRQ